MVVFLNSYSGNAKQSGKPYTRYSLGKVEKDEKGFLVMRTYDYFTKSGEPLKGTEGLQFGDVIKPEFAGDELMGERPDLVGIVKVSGSPYTVLL